MPLPTKEEMLMAADGKRHIKGKCVFHNEYVVPLYRTVPCEDKFSCGLLWKKNIKIEHAAQWILSPGCCRVCQVIISSCGGLEITISNYKSIGLYGTTRFRANTPLSKAQNKRNYIVCLSRYVYMLDVAPRVLLLGFVWNVGRLLPVYRVPAISNGQSPSREGRSRRHSAVSVRVAGKRLWCNEAKVNSGWWRVDGG